MKGEKVKSIRKKKQDGEGEETQNLGGQRNERYDNKTP
jgi:hypothetical protein